MRLSDEQLVKEYSSEKHPEALEILIKRYLPRIFGYVKNYTGNKEAAADITQEVFVKVWKNICKFDTSANFSSWIFTIAKRTAIDELRKKNAVPFSLLKDKGLIENIRDTSVGIVAGIEGKELAFAIASLPNKYRSIIKSHSDGFSFREIAEQRREPVNTVKSRYRRGLEALRKKLNA
jgi:RNA polymerase sigma-70 factor (ECF subfamily)